MILNCCRLLSLLFALVVALPLMASEGPPTPPTKPVYSNSYFNLTWSWTGTGFSISSSGVAQANTSTTTYSGTLSAFESWQLASVDGTLKWVETGIYGGYSKGQETTSKPGYASYTMSTSSSYSLPSNSLMSTSYSEQSQTDMAGGQQTLTSISTMTLYGGGSPFYIKGTSSIRVTDEAATIISYTTNNLTWTGPVKPTTNEWIIQSTTYTDTNRKLFARNANDDKTTTSTYNPNGSVASEIITDMGSVINYTVIPGANGSQQNPILTRLLTNSQSSQQNDSTGAKQTSESTTRTRTTINQVLTSATGTKSVVPSSDAVDCTQNSQNVAWNTNATTTFTRTTTWSGDGTYVLSWEEAYNPGAGTLTLIWNKNGVLQSATSVLGSKTSSYTAAQVLSLYQSAYGLESSLMQMPPPAGDYPFYPQDQVGSGPG